MKYQVAKDQQKSLMCNLLHNLVLKKSLSIIPIIPGEKRPGYFSLGTWRGLNTWNNYSKHLPNADDLELWTTWDLKSLGLITGKLSNVIALDYDHREDIGNLIQKNLPYTPLRKVGEKGHTAFYRYNGEKSQKWSIDGKTIVELLSDGHQTLIPPSLHPNGMNYRWLEEYDFETVDLLNLQVLQKEHIHHIQKIISSFKIKSNNIIESKTNRIDSSDFDEVEVIKALDFISADSYETWIRVGMALHSKGEIGFKLWDSWSSKSSKYKEQEMRKKWNSLSSKSINLGSIFYEAKNNGYCFPISKNQNELVKQEIKKDNLKSSSSQLIDCTVYIDKPPPKRNTIIPGIMDHLDKVVVIGPPKSNKSFFCLQMALAIASGREFIDIPILEAKKVLFYNLELKPNVFHSRIHEMTHQMKLNIEELKGNLFVIHARGIQTDLKELQNIIKKEKVEVLFLDPLYKLMTESENDDVAMKKLLAEVDSLSLLSSTVMVHHDSKVTDRSLTSRGSGSNVLIRDYDYGIYLSNHQNEQNVRVLESVSRAYESIPSRSIEFVYPIFYPSIEAPKIETSKARRSKSERFLASDYVEWVKGLFKDGPLTSSSLNETISSKGISDKRRSHLLKFMEEKQYLKVRNHSPKKGLQKLYGLPHQIDD